MYIIKLGQSYVSDYVGIFESMTECYDWLEKQDIDSDSCTIICIVNKSDYNMRINEKKSDCATCPDSYNLPLEPKKN